MSRQERATDAGAQAARDMPPPGTFLEPTQRLSDVQGLALFPE